MRSKAQKSAVMKSTVSGTMFIAYDVMMMSSPPTGKLKGVMRVGAFARSLMLRGECSVDLALMSTGMLYL